MSKTTKTTDEDYFIRGAEVRERLGKISTTTLWRMIRDGKFPAGIKLGDKTVVYKNSWVVKMLELDAGADLDKIHGTVHSYADNLKKSSKRLCGVDHE